MIDLTFSVVGARAEPHAAAPTLVFRLRVSQASPALVHTAVLRCQLQIDPRRRRYTSAEGERLFELFGEPERWNDTMSPLMWTRVPVVVPRFEDAVEIELPVSCTYDFEVASAKYFQVLEDGEIPLVFLFSGTVFVAAPGGFHVEQVPWDKEALFRLPVDTWREAMDQHFHGNAWIRLRRETVDTLDRFRMRRALASWDDAVEALCSDANLRETV